MNSTSKATLVVIGFSLAGSISSIFFAPRTESLAPHMLFYAFLVVNTFYSVQRFAAITPTLVSQVLIDTVLVVIYIALALTIGFSLLFPLIVTILFVVATLKYMLLRGKIPYETLLQRKIRLDALGALFAAAIFALVFLGYPLLAAWLMAGIFLLANMYLLFIKPMYRL